MPKLPVIKPVKLVKVLKKLGFYKFHQVGNHVQFKHLDGRRVTVPYHKTKEIRRGTLKGIINDINISRDELIKLLRK